MDETTTEDTLLAGKVRLLQPVGGYRAAIDPVLLAACIPAREGDRVLELGSGTGAAAFCLATRIKGVGVVGLEKNALLVALSEESRKLNDLKDQVAFMPGDLLRPSKELEWGSYDHVMANPPYLAAESGHPPPDPIKATANVEGEAKLEDWVLALVTAVKHKGSVSMIHRADRLDEIMSAFHGRIGGLKVMPFWPASGKPAKRVIVQGRKGVSGPLTLCPGLVLHEADGAYTEAANVVLRDGHSLTFKTREI